MLAGAHLTQAALLLAAPPAALHMVAGDRGVPPTWLVRVLGARTLVQGAAEAVRPTPGVLRLGVAVDMTHAASMLFAASRGPRYRRAAWASAGAAASSALAGALLTRNSR